jgi:hypothetical protein
MHIVVNQRAGVITKFISCHWQDNLLHIRNHNVLSDAIADLCICTYMDSGVKAIKSEETWGFLQMPRPPFLLNLSVMMLYGFP